MSSSILRGLRAGFRLLPAAAETAKPLHMLSQAVRARQVAFPARHITTTRPAFSLADALKQEMDFEAEAKQNAEQPTALEAVPEGWTLDVKPGKALMRLTRQGAPDNATIVISTNDQEGIEDDEEPQAEGETPAPSYAISFDLRCSRGDQTLQMSMTYLEDDKEDPQIEHVACLPTSQIDTESSDLYSGPQFTELDENVQKEFMEFARSRGVTAEVGQYLCQLVYDKEQDEYLRWMKRVHSFVSEDT